MSNSSSSAFQESTTLEPAAAEAGESGRGTSSGIGRMLD